MVKATHNKDNGAVVPRPQERDAEMEEMPVHGIMEMVERDLLRAKNRKYNPFAFDPKTLFLSSTKKRSNGIPRTIEIPSITVSGNIHPAYEIFMLWRKEHRAEERRLEKIAKAERERAYRAELYDRVPIPKPPAPNRVLTPAEKKEARALKYKLSKEKSAWYQKVRRLPPDQRPRHWKVYASEMPPPGPYIPPLVLTDAEQEQHKQDVRDLLADVWEEDFD